MSTFSLRTLLATLATVLSLGACAATAFEPTSRHCKPLTAEQRGWLGDRADWAPHLRHVRACAMRGPGSGLLVVVSIWADLLYASLPGTPTVTPLPAPILFDGAGRERGRLPANFPSDPPAELQLHASDWHQGLPRRLGLCLRTPAAGGDQPLPALHLDPAQGRYVASAGDTRPGDCDGR